jgi:LacI family transcriptional regulator
MSGATMRPSRSGANPNLVDVARRAGVSRGTVSNVLNYPEKVLPGTLDRVQRAISDLGYVRNDAARSLAAGRSASLGFVLPNIENSLFVDMIYGAQERSTDTGLSVLVGNSADSEIQQDAYLNLFDEARVAGVLLAPMEDASAGIQRMRSHGRQIVLLNFNPHDHDCCVVLADNEMVGYLAARHLIETGRRRLAYVAGKDNLQPVHARRLGVRRAVAEAGNGVTLEEVETPSIYFDDGLSYGDRFLATAVEDRPDGVVAVTDVIANGFMQRVMEQGFGVPSDVAVVGCENNRSAVRGPLALTGVETQGREMGIAATALLLDEISTPADEHEHRVLTYPARLIARESTLGRAYASS